MDAMSFAGYGFDVIDFDLTVLTNAERHRFGQLIDSEYVIDAADELRDHGIYDDITVGTPCNTDDFELFIYLPDQPVVSADPQAIKRYNYHEANQRLTAYFKALMHDLNSMEQAPLDQAHTGVFLSLVRKLSAQIDDDDRPLPDWRVYTDYC